MATVYLDIKNFDKQQTIFDSKAKHKIAAKGRRFGLTKGAANDYIKQALNGTFKAGLWVDTIVSNINRYIERYFMPHLKKVPPDMWKWRKQENMLIIRNSYIDFRSADRPENIEGFGYDKYFVNEAGIVLRNPYLWDNAIRPMLWDNKNSQGVLGGTPKGKGQFFELYNRGLDPNQKNYSAHRFSTFDNPYLDSVNILEEIKSMPERVVKQEIYAEFLDDTGVVFRGVLDVATLQPEEPILGELYVIGADLAKVQDYTVLTVYRRKNNHQVYQMRFNHLEWPFQKEKIKALSRKYNNALVIIDSTGVGEPIHDDLSRDSVPVMGIRFSNEIKKQLIEKLVNWIELKEIRMLNLEETINELNNFTYDISSQGKVRYEAPVGFHDDICFVAGTKILTNKGQMPIEKIKIGDKVRTRDGFHRVVNTMSRKTKVITNKHLNLTGTANHPVITPKGIMPLENVRDIDILYIWNEKLSRIEERTIIDTQMLKDGNLAHITGDTINGSLPLLLYTDKYGLITMVRYLKGILFIIKTAILSIMKLPTLSYLAQVNTQYYIQDHQKEESNRLLMQRNKGEDYMKISLNGKNSSQLKKENARNVKLHLQSNHGLSKSSVQQNANGEMLATVYNLTIEGLPEYFANNILVHNCISHALAIWGLQPIIPEKKPENISLIERDMREKTNFIVNPSLESLDWEAV